MPVCTDPSPWLHTRRLVVAFSNQSTMREETATRGGIGESNHASVRLTRLTVDMEIEVLEALDKLRQEMGMRSRGALLNQLLREILIAEEHPRNTEKTGN